MDFEYEGKAYVRPIGRGVVLLDHSLEPDVGEVVPEGYYKMKLSFERIEKPEVE